ncbi:hypothetical protein, partial [Escherichia coli]|uniref:hypothetical protein n=1 Tax=Escherichia coli TaxID=562 RepID=UPI003B9DFBFC
MRAKWSASGPVGTLPLLCDQLLRAAGITPDFQQPDAFGRLVAVAAEREVTPAFLCDSVIVDEGQDFAPAWRD